MTYKKRLLCIIYEPGNFQGFLKIAQYGQKSGSFDVILWSPYCLPDSERYQLEAANTGAVYIDEATRAGSLADIHTRLSGWLSSKPLRLPRDYLAWLEGKIGENSVNTPLAGASQILDELSIEERRIVVSNVDHINRRINYCEDWLVRLGVDTVLFAEDNVERDSYAWIAGAKRRGIKTVVSSYGAISIQEAVNAYKHSPVHAISDSQALLVRRHLPHWLASGEDFSITRLPFYEAIARELSQTSVFNPWLVNSGNVDVIALESQAMKDAYIALGFPAEKLKPIGHPMHDQLAIDENTRKILKNELLTKYKLDPHRPLAIVALPPDQTTVRACSYRGYNQIVDAFSKLPTAVAKANVIVSPHPNITGDQLDWIRMSETIVAEKPLADMLPLADFFVASVSSTIKWALGLGLPVINYDCYGYDYSDYKNTRGVLTASSHAEFSEALKIIGNDMERSILSSDARRMSKYWGEIDGKAKDRLIHCCLA